MHSRSRQPVAPSSLLSLRPLHLLLLITLILLLRTETMALEIETTPLGIISKWGIRDLQRILQRAQHCPQANLKVLYQILRYKRFPFESHYYLLEPIRALYEAILERGQGERQTEVMLTILPLNRLQAFQGGRHLLTDHLVPNQGYPIDEEWDPSRFEPPQQLSLLRHINAGQARGHLEVSLCSNLIDAGAFDLIVEEGETLWQLVDWIWFEECLHHRSRDISKVISRLLGALQASNGAQNDATNKLWTETSMPRPSPTNAPSDDLALYRLLMMHSSHRYPATQSYLKTTREKFEPIHLDMVTFFRGRQSKRQSNKRLNAFHRILAGARVPPHLRPAWIMEHVLLASTNGGLSWESLLPTLLGVFQESLPLQVPPYMTRKLLGELLPPEHHALIYQNLSDAWRTAYQACHSGRCHFPKKHQPTPQRLLNWQRRYLYRLSYQGEELNIPALGGLLNGSRPSPPLPPSEEAPSIEHEIERIATLMSELGQLTADESLRFVCRIEVLPSIIRLWRGRLLTLALYDEPLPQLAPSIIKALLMAEFRAASQGQNPRRHRDVTPDDPIEPLDICTTASIEANPQEAREVARQLVLQLFNLFKQSHLPVILCCHGGRATQLSASPPSCVRSR